MWGKLSQDGYLSQRGRRDAFVSPLKFYILYCDYLACLFAFGLIYYAIGPLSKEFSRLVVIQGDCRLHFSKIIRLTY